jgi:hypothetical protein
MQSVVTHREPIVKPALALVTAIGAAVSRGEHGHAMRACRARADVAIEIDVEVPVELQMIPRHVDHMDLVVAFHVDDPAGQQIFDEKVVRHHQARPDWPRWTGSPRTASPQRPRIRPQSTALPHSRADHQRGASVVHVGGIERRPIVRCDLQDGWQAHGAAARPSAELAGRGHGAESASPHARLPGWSGQ